MAFQRIGGGRLAVFVLAVAVNPAIAAPPGSEAEAATQRAAIRQAIATHLAARTRGNARIALDSAGTIDWQIKMTGKDLGPDDLAVIEAGAARAVFDSAWNLEVGRADDARKWADHAIRTFADRLPTNEPLRSLAFVQRALVDLRITGRPAAEVTDLERSLLLALDQFARARSRGDTRSAREAAGLAADRARKGFGFSTPERARATLALVDLAIDAGDPGRNGLAEAVRALPKGDPLRVQALARSGEVKLVAGDREASLRLLEQAIAEAAERPTENFRTRSSPLILAASIRFARGEDGEPLAVSLLAATVSRLPPGDPDSLAALAFFDHFIWSRRVDQAIAAVTGGSTIEEAEGKLRSEIERLNQAVRDAGADLATAALGWIALARFEWKYQRIGETSKTLARLEGSIDDPRVAPFLSAEYWSFRGLVETERSQYARARSHFERACAISEGAGLAQLAHCRNNLGQLLLRLGDYESAREQLQRAVEQYARSPDLKDNPGRPFALTNLAKALEADGHYEEPERMHREALEIAGRTRDPTAEALCRNNLGINLYSAGRFPEARAEFEIVRERVARELGADHLRVAEVEVNLAWLEVAEKRPDEAERRLRLAIKIARADLGDDHPRSAEMLGYLARVLAGKGQIEEARGLLIEAVRLRGRFLDRTLRTSLSGRDQLAFVQELRVHHESIAWPGVLDTYLDLGAEVGIPTTDRYRQVLNWKGVVARHAPARPSATDSPEVRSLFDRRETVVRKLQDAALIKPTRDGRRKFEEDRASWEAEAEDLERQLHRKTADGVAPDPNDTTPADVAGALPARSALLDVIEVRRYRPRRPGEPIADDRRYLGFLVRPGREVAPIDLGDASVLDAAVTDLVAELSATGGNPANPAAQVGRAIREPLRRSLDGVNTLIVAGDGLLHRLPLGALPGDRPGSLWIEDLAFASVPTAQSLVARRRRPRPKSAGLVAVGGVDYGPMTGNARRSADWSPLEHTRAEAESIAGLFRGTHPGESADLLTGKEAGETPLRSLLPRRRFAHLATHGFFRRGDQAGSGFATFGVRARLDSGIVLAGANRAVPDDPEDHFLTAEEVAGLDLSGLELVVLSACESGLGHLSSGQGSIGLLGAFDSAGTSAVVSALWKVDDRETAAMMGAFYRHLWSDPGSSGPAGALRAAQLDRIRDHRSGSGDRGAGGRYWAGFILSGDPFAPDRSGAIGPKGLKR